MKHIFNAGDRVQDSRNPSRKGKVVDTEIVDTGTGVTAYGLDYASDGYNGWSDWPYKIRWDDRDTPAWTDSEYAEPEGWEVVDKYSARDEEQTYIAPEGMDLQDVLRYGKPAHFIRSNVPTVDLKEGDVVDVFSATVGTPEVDPIKPDYYRFPSGAAVIDISRYLTGNGAQVVQYVSRSTRLDGRNKGDVLENLRKAQWFLQDEIERLEALDD